jgi:hypothetical protein
MTERRPEKPAGGKAGDSPCYRRAFSPVTGYASGMPLYRCTMTWAGFVGAPGYTTLHFLDPDPITQAGIDQTAARNNAFWQALEPHLPGPVTITMPTILEEIDTATGELLDEHTFPGGTLADGAGSSVYSAAAGACINWNTVGIVNGRRLRGRTFIVPLQASSYESDGTLTTVARDALVTAGNNLANATTGIDLAVWHRPSPGGSDGVAAGVTSCSVNDRGAVLRSRRD